MMKRCAFLLTLVAGIALCPTVQAQTVTCEITRLGDNSFDGTTHIGRDDCESGSVTIEVIGPSGYFYTAESGPKCNAQRTECLQIEEERQIPISGSDTFDIEIKELLDYYEASCETANQSIRVRIFYRDTVGFEDSVECNEITVDTQGPVAPTIVGVKPGENAIKVSWGKVDDAARYKVFYKVIEDCEEKVKDAFEALVSYQETSGSNPDAQVIADAGTADTNEEIDTRLLELIVFEHSETASGTDHTLKNKAEPGEELLIVVKAVDSGGNESDPSWPECVEVIETYGFCDSTDSCKDGCTVGPIGRNHARAGAGVVVGLLILFALVCARRRSRP